MTVGINAKIGPAIPEGAPSAAPEAAGEGGGFAQLLTGIAASPAKITGKVAATTVVKVVGPAVGAGQEDADALVANTPGESKPTADPSLTPGIAQCVIDLHGLGRMIRFGQGPKQPGEGSDAAKDEGEEIAKGEGETEAAVPATPTVAADPALALQLAAAAKPTPAPAPAPGTADGTPILTAAPADPAILIASPGTAPNGPDTAQPQLEKLLGLPKAAKRSELAQSAQPLDFGKLAEAPNPAELQQLLRTLAHHGRGGVDSAAALQASAAAAALDTPAGDEGLAATSPLGGSLLPNNPLQALIQPQLGAGMSTVGAPSDAGAAMSAAAPDLSLERHLDIEHDAQWLDRLARDIASTGGNDGPLRFRLHPETLGSLHVEVQQSHAGTTIRMTADTEAARSIIADAQPRLIAEARAQGVRIADAYVGMNSNGQHADQRRQDDGGRQGFVRTSRAAEVEPDQVETNATAAAERFA